MKTPDYSLDVLFVNPQVTTDRPDGSRVGTIGVPEGQIMRCINPGILSIATYLDARGYTVAILDLSEAKDTKKLENFLQREYPRVIGISCTTGFSYRQSLKAASSAKQLTPQSLIVLGGQHVGPLGAKVFADCDAVQAISLYEGEIVTEKLIRSTYGDGNLTDIPGIAFRIGQQVAVNAEMPPLIGLEEIAPLRYDLYPDYASFTPYVEESRGCFAKCEFCVTPFTNGMQLRCKSPQRVFEEAKRAIDMFGSGKPLALLASTFGSHLSHTLDLLDLIGKLGIQWTTELRGDNPLTKYLSRMVGCGASAFFIGVESASPEQLLRMRKTAKPLPYLESIRALLHEGRRWPDLIIKLGFLFYVGETLSTMGETLDFLSAEAEYIDWISVSPLFVFDGTPLASQFASYAQRFGCSLHTDGFWGESHIYPCNVSPVFPFQKCVSIAQSLEEAYRTPGAYSNRTLSMNFDQFYEPHRAEDRYGTTSAQI